MPDQTFVGKYLVKLDSKSRIAIPIRLREAGGEGGSLWTRFYMTPGTEGCVFVYTPEGWRSFLEGLGATRTVGDETLRSVQRLIAADVEFREADGQGRIIFSNDLRLHAGI